MAREGQHDAQLRIRGDTKSADKELARLGNRVNSLEGKVSRSNKTLAAKSQALQTAGRAAAAFTAAIVAAGAATFRFVSATTEQVDKIAKTSRALGASAEEYQRVAFAAERSGASMQTLDRGLRTMTVGLQDAALRGTGPVADGLKALGLELKDLQGLSMERQFGVLADALQKVDDEQTKAGISAKIFGARAGVELSNVLRLGSDGIGDLGDELERMGGVIEDDALKKAEDFQDELLGMEKQILKVKAEIASALIPTLYALRDAFNEVAQSEFGGFLKETAIGVGGFITGTGVMARQLEDRSAAAKQRASELRAENRRLAKEMGLDPDDPFGRKAADAAAAKMTEALQAGVRMEGQRVTGLMDAAQRANEEALRNATRIFRSASRGHRQRIDEFAQERAAFEQALAQIQTDENFGKFGRATFENTREFERELQRAQQQENFARLGEIREDERLQREQAAEDEREAMHQRALERDREAEESKKAVWATTVQTSQAGFAIQRNITGMAGALADASIRDDEKRARFKQRMAGIEAIGIGILETVKAAAAFASFNYVQGALHTSAAALAFVQGGLLMSGNATSGGGGGRISAANTGPGIAPAANTPPGGELSESPIPPSSAGGPRNTPESPTAPQQGGGKTINVNIANVHGTADRNFARSLALELRDLEDEGFTARAG